ncbi:MAG: dTDP-4-dehydrorhamnose 3,5-epimerase [Candidatus Phaeomarinobacter sp.]
MNLSETDIHGVIRIDLAPIRDDRGFFARSFCRQTLAEAGLEFDMVQSNLSFNAQAGTLRGMHYQAAPLPDPKIVRCERGTIYDVAVDLRPGSPTFRSWTAAELSAENGSALLIPAGCAHGFISLTDNTQVLYLMGAAYDADLARGLRWDDPAFAIEWPIQPSVIAARDAAYPDFEVE